MYQKERECEECPATYVAHSTQSRRCPRCQSLHRREVKKSWLRKKAPPREVEMNHDPNYEFAIYCG